MLYLNLGILAHVDAGKTTLTERLLFNAGVIDKLGSVDAGTTQTDTLALERQRGITIKAAVASFGIGDTTVNLIDTPGHPDFIAEVERVLGVLDGVVLVISAVEGVQPQTRVLMRALQRLRIPTLFFVNKIDRAGAQDEQLLQTIAAKLSPAIVPLGTTTALGTRGAAFALYEGTDQAFFTRLLDQLAEHDDSLLAVYIHDEAAVSYQRLRSALATQTAQALAHPVFFGAAMTGAGVNALMAGIAELLPKSHGSAQGAPIGTVFKIERGPAGEKIAYLRLFAGTINVRDQLHFGRGKAGRVTALSVFEHGTAARNTTISAGQIGKLWGLADVRIGDQIGSAPSDERHYFAPPSLETLIVPRRPAERAALYATLTQLAEQDPLINLRKDEVRQELFVSLYGEVQKEVIQATLATDYHIDVEFQATTTICVERPVGSGAAVEFLGKEPNPFIATVGIRIEPGPIDSGLVFRIAVDRRGTLPLAFFNAVEESVHETVRQGLYGWQLTDCIVTMTHSGYSSVASTAGDFRNLTPLIVMDALQQAETRVYEPLHHFELEIPAESFGRIAMVLAQLRAVAHPPQQYSALCLVEGVIPAAQVHTLRQQLPSLTRGEGVLESAFACYQAVEGVIPRRPRTDHNPLDRKEYLLHVVRRV